jgi:hypothetical protein
LGGFYCKIGIFDGKIGGFGGFVRVKMGVLMGEIGVWGEF